MHRHIFSSFSTKGNNFCDFLFASLDNEVKLHVYYSVQGNNALLGDQIMKWHSHPQFEKASKIKMAELLS